MSKLEELIQQYCPDGVEYKRIEDICDISRGVVISKDDIRDNPGDYPVYSSQTENNGELGKISTYMYEGEYLTWTTDGANAGFVFYREGKFNITNVCGLLKVKDTKDISIEYLYHTLAVEAPKAVNRGMGNPKLMSNQMARIEVPVPALPVQREIARILGEFSLLSAELAAELAARKQQYEFYREKLFTEEKDVEYKTLEEVCELITGATPSTSKKEFWENGTVSWLSSGEVNKKRIYETDTKITELGYKNASTTLVPPKSVVIALAGQGKTRGKVAITEIELCTNQSLCSLVCRNNILPEYLYFYLDGKYEELRAISNGDGTRGGLSLRILKPYKIPVPAIQKQHKIVETLKRFDLLINDISEGLPAEIEARQKQYEYYRDKILDFKRK